MAAKTNQQTLDAVKFVKEGNQVSEAAKKFGVHRTTIWRALQREQEQDQEPEREENHPLLGYP